MPLVVVGLLTTIVIGLLIELGLIYRRQRRMAARLELYQMISRHSEKV